MQLVRKLEEIVGRAGLHGEMIWIALFAQGLIWLQSRLFPNRKERETESQRILSEDANKG